jgi:hypothetical protein
MGSGSFHRDSMTTGGLRGSYVAQGNAGRFSSGSTPPHDTSPPNGSVRSLVMVEEETPVPAHYQRTSDQPKDYFAAPGASSHNDTPGSGTSSNSESKFGTPGEMNTSLSAAQREERKKSEEIKRRGSVDERTMTLGGGGVGRLFIANPDLD